MPAAICGPAASRIAAKAVCTFCDTDFVGTDGPGGGTFKTAEDLAHAVEAKWPQGARGKRYVVCTGGEPLLQLDTPLIEALHRLGFEVGVETNGTQAAPEGLDWICVSPKADAELKLTRGNELKLVYPQDGCAAGALRRLAFDHFFLQPMDDPNRDGQHEGGDGILPRPSAMAAVACRRTS